MHLDQKQPCPTVSENDGAYSLKVIVTLLLGPELTAKAKIYRVFYLDGGGFKNTFQNKIQNLSSLNP